MYDKTYYCIYVATELTMIIVTQDFLRSHTQLVKLVKALNDAGPSGLSTRKLCEIYHLVKQQARFMIM